MWAKDSNIVGHNEHQGTTASKRTDVCEVISNACAIQAHGPAIIALAADLLPFLPSRESAEFTIEKSRPSGYLKGIAPIRPFQAMMYFLRSIKYRFRDPSYEDTAQEMADAFESDGPLSLGDDPAYTQVINALQKWNPTKKPQKKAYSDAFVDRIKNVILVETARSLNATFSVYSHI